MVSYDRQLDDDVEDPRKELIGIGVLCALGIAAVWLAWHCWDGGNCPPGVPAGVERLGGGHRTAEMDRRNRCWIDAYLNGVQVTFMVDTGAPRAAEIPSELLPRLGIDGSRLNYEQFWPGTRYGDIARVRMRELRIGGLVLNNPEVWVYNNWGYSFGRDTAPLLGMETLKHLNFRIENHSCTISW
jgi:predicted aspartyl protease